ncbi:MAG: terminase large subunit domain-containing protein [Acidimicrobiales bacterium]
MDEALSVDAHGLPVWKSVVLVLPRKNGKTALLAAYSLYHLLEDDGRPEILLAASSDKQAGRLFDAVVAFVRRNPELAARVHLREYIGEIARVDGGGKMLRMASDPNRAHGYEPSKVVMDELHAWTTPGLKKLFAALTTGGGSRSNAQAFTITTPGDAETRDSSILGRLIDGNEAAGEVERGEALTVSRNFVGQTLVFNYSAPTRDRQDVRAVKKANPASWITVEYLKRQAANPELSDGEFLQLHAGVWASGRDVWVDDETWDKLEVAGLEVPAGASVAVGLDASLTYDTTACAVAWLLEDGRVGHVSHVWAARRDVAAHELADGGRIDLAVVERHVAELAARLDVRLVVYDPRFFERSAQILTEEHGLLCVSFNQQAKMPEAAQLWYADVQAAGVAHDGCRVLREHVLATGAEKTDRGWRLSKIRQARPIDAHVAAVMAHWGARTQLDQGEAWSEEWADDAFEVLA